MKAIATFHTGQATRHLAALCKHFGHKVDVRFDAQAGEVDFLFGHCALFAETGQLRFEASAENGAQLDQVTEIITRHLERFAFRENPTLDWHPPEPHGSEPAHNT